MLIVLMSIIAALALALAVTRFSGTKDKSSSGSARMAPPADCCGAHEVCEKDLLLSTNTKVEYFNDEELDQFKDREARCYNNSETEQFREVLYTMREDEVAAWIRSLQNREIQPPSIIREEALMIVAELRAAELMQ